MRLGAIACQVRASINGKPTRASGAYKKELVQERHRHRYEVNPDYRKTLEERGLVISGEYQDPRSGISLVEIAELAEHPWFVGCQFHPEFLSKPLLPHPLFAGFIGAAKQRRVAS